MQRKSFLTLTFVLDTSKVKFEIFVTRLCLIQAKLNEFKEDKPNMILIFLSFFVVLLKFNVLTENKDYSQSTIFCFLAILNSDFLKTQFEIFQNTLKWKFYSLNQRVTNKPSRSVKISTTKTKIQLLKYCKIILSKIFP